MEAIIGPLFPLSFIVLLGVERLLSPRRQPRVRRWAVRGLLFFVVGLAINATAPALVAPRLAALAPIDLSRLPLAAASALLILATSLPDYFIHRGMHRFHGVWRWTHQMHHSAERVDLFGFAYSHPFELVISVLSSTVVGSLLGFSPDAVIVGSYLYFVTQLFVHMEIDSPRWIGWFLQRPEGHRVHHTRGVHAYNYGLPLWDMLFGTWRNPETWDREYGFWDGASAATSAMLLGRDVGTPPPAVR